MSKKLFTNFSALKWEHINWFITRHYVARLQNRIYTAAFNQQYKKLHKLQKKLLFSSHSKLLSVFITTQHKSIYINSCNKLNIARYLVTSSSSYQVYLACSTYLKTKKENQQLLLSLIKQARQLLCELIFKPEWTAKTFRNLYKFTISDYNKYHKIVKIIRNLHKVCNTYTLTLDLAMYIMYGNYLGVVTQLPKASSLFLQYAIKRWLQKENLFAFKARKDLFNNLSSYVALQKNSLPVQIIISLFINNLSSWLIQKKFNLKVKFFINNSQLIFLCKNLSIQFSLVSFIKRWFVESQTDIRLLQVRLSNTYSGFDFLGFRIQKKQKSFVVTISSKSKILLWYELSKIIRRSKSVSSYQLIQRLSPRIAFWGNYFKYSQCLEVFSHLDYLLHLRIWIWLLRRHSVISKSIIVHNYFPKNKKCIYNQFLLKSNWIFYGFSEKTFEECFLVRFLWFKYLRSGSC
uniref:Reverse transcriptase N-terminal domain-containing protein n=1 Tax=Apophlaea sinclairii TaxID=212746 RepID=A0A1C9CBD0_9FLOR|nr:hypothetical protein Apop_013 [Apophlaea sinclairii]AOM65703.1 hypothetical protein Apop_013 [Apophlaea sinclairii]